MTKQTLSEQAQMTTVKGNREERRSKAKKLKKEIKENGLKWEELEDAYRTAKSLVEPVLVIVNTVRRPEILDNIDKAEAPFVRINIQNLTSIIKQYFAEIDELYKQHAGRTGPVSLEDYATALMISEAYLNATLRNDAAMEHSRMHLIDIAQNAELKYLEKNKPEIAEEVKKQMEQQPKVDPFVEGRTQAMINAGLELLNEEDNENQEEAKPVVH